MSVCRGKESIFARRERRRERVRYLKRSSSVWRMMRGKEEEGEGVGGEVRDSMREIYIFQLVDSDSGCVGLSGRILH